MLSETVMGIMTTQFCLFLFWPKYDFFQNGYIISKLFAVYLFLYKCFVVLLINVLCILTSASFQYSHKRHEFCRRLSIAFHSSRSCHTDFDGITTELYMYVSLSAGLLLITRSHFIKSDNLTSRVYIFLHTSTKSELIPYIKYELRK